MAEEIIVPLSSIDSAGFHQLNITVAYVLRSVDAYTVETAAERVVDKWRLLAGRMESNGKGFFHIRVPLGELPEDYQRISFTVSKLSTSLDVKIPRLDADATILFDRPSLHFFRHSSTPHDIGTYATKQLPILSIHITHLADCSCVGITFPHGVFDGVGMARVLRAIGAELDHREWTPPLMSSVNSLDRALNSVGQQDLEINKEQEMLMRGHLEEDLAPIGVSSVAAFGRNLLYERVWQQSEHHTIFFGGNSCKRLLQECQEDLKDKGIQDVRLSMADVLLAWFIKNSYSDASPSDLPVALICATNFRQYLQALEPDISDYPHNGLFVMRQLTSTVRQLQKMTVAQVASKVRQATEDHRGLPYIQLCEKFVSDSGGSFVFKRSTDSDAWVHSNQTIARSDLFGWGTEVLGIWHFMLPMTSEKTMTMHHFKGGMMLDGRIRKSQWRSLQKELEKMNAERRDTEGKVQARL